MDATDRLCCMLDERGIEYVSIGGITNWGHAEYDELADGSDTRLIVLGATPKQAIAATVECGNLTAEQVREAIMSANRWKKPMGDTGMTNTHLIIRDDGWQAIADELNATVGAGTCKLVIEKRRRHGPWIYHFGCGYDFWQPTDCPMPILKHCPNCGKKVEKVSE